jgi:murein DD-endopeptidase MepM/ murein hydrolase activator NlpD
MNNNRLLIISFLSVTCVALLLGVLIKKQQSNPRFAEVTSTAHSTIDTVRVPVIKYGLNLSEFVVIDQTVEKNEAFSDIFLKHNVAYQTISYLIKESKDIFNCKKIRAGNKYAVIGTNSDTGFVAKKIVYEENKLNYVIFNLDDSLYIYRGQNEVEHKHQEVAGVVEGSLYETFDNMDIPSDLAVRIADIFSCTIDFYKIQKGDKFKIIYDQDFVKGETLAVGQIDGVEFTSGGKDYYAFYYEKDKSHGGEYFDENGNSMRKQFLKAPLKFFRITSKYSLNRFHPVVKEWRAHLGTDYAAAPGTPILATGDGVVEEAQFGVYNGNYVKIRHNGEYKTQYLHMSKIATGMHAGRKVKQGEVIGYVGMTGLATGPHVCYRFWKDGQQVDPFKQKLQFSEPLPKKYKGDYMAKITPFKTNIDKISYGTKPSIPVDEKKQDVQAKALAAAQISASR